LHKDEGKLNVSLRLAAIKRPALDYTIFVHLEGPEGQIVAQADAMPLAGAYPTSIWDPGEELLSTWEVSLPDSLERGDYRVWVGAYYWPTGERLPVQADGYLVSGDRLLLEVASQP